MRGEVENIHYNFIEKCFEVNEEEKNIIFKILESIYNRYTELYSFKKSCVCDVSYFSGVFQTLVEFVPNMVQNITDREIKDFIEKKKKNLKKDFNNVETDEKEIFNYIKGTLSWK